MPCEWIQVSEDSYESYYQDRKEQETQSQEGLSDQGGEQPLVVSGYG